MAKPWENNSGCNDFTAYRALKAVEEEEARIAAQNRAILRGVDAVEYVKKNGKKIATVALAGTAIVAAAAISKSQQKKSRTARKVALIGEIREWLSVFR